VARECVRKVRAVLDRTQRDGGRVREHSHLLEQPERLGRRQVRRDRDAACTLTLQRDGAAAAERWNVPADPLQRHSLVEEAKVADQRVGVGRQHQEAQRAEAIVERHDDRVGGVGKEVAPVHGVRACTRDPAAAVDVNQDAARRRPRGARRRRPDVEEETVLGGVGPLARWLHAARAELGGVDNARRRGHSYRCTPAQRAQRRLRISDAEEGVVVVARDTAIGA